MPDKEVDPHRSPLGEAISDGSLALTGKSLIVPPRSPCPIQLALIENQVGVDREPAPLSLPTGPWNREMHQFIVIRLAVRAVPSFGLSRKISFLGELGNGTRSRAPAVFLNWRGKRLR